MSTAPTEIPIPGTLAKWTLVPANRLAMTMQAATLTISEGREWDVTTAMPGLAVFLNTDLDHPDPGGFGKAKARYMLDVAEMVRDATQVLISGIESSED